MIAYCFILVGSLKTVFRNTKIIIDSGELNLSFIHLSLSCAKIRKNRKEDQIFTTRYKFSSDIVIVSSVPSSNLTGLN